MTKRGTGLHCGNSKDIGDELYEVLGRDSHADPSFEPSASAAKPSKKADDLVDDHGDGTTDFD